MRGPKNDAADGGPSLVRVSDGRGRPLGIATWAARPRLALRMLTRDGQPEPKVIKVSISEANSLWLGKKARAMEAA